MHRIADIAGRNNFDGVRIFLALNVFFAHAQILSQSADLAILSHIFDSHFAVTGFFAISGYLIMKSYHSSSGLWNFADKRLRRIYPAYFAAIMLCFAIGMVMTTLPIGIFLTSGQTVKYLASNLVFLNFIQPALPGVFTDNFMDAMDGSLWTIKIEAMLYCCIPFIAWSFRKWGAPLATLLMVAASIGWVWFFTYRYTGSHGAEIARQFPGQASYFVLGAFFAMYKPAADKLLCYAIPAWAGLLLLDGTLARLCLEPLAYASLVLWLSTRACRDLRLGRFGDVSYGVYLYHFPIVQTLVALGVFAAAPWSALGLAFMLTLLTAWLSWHGIEKHWLKRSSHYRRAELEANQRPIAASSASR